MNGPIEPNATSRAFAAVCYQMFVALTLEGFAREDALLVIGQVIAASVMKD